MHKFSVTLDGVEQTSQLPQFRPGALLRGTVSLTPDSAIHLSGINVLLGWSVARLETFNASSSDRGQFELLGQRLLAGYGNARAVRPGDPKVRVLKYWKGPVKTVDSRNITGKSDPDFPDTVVPHKIYSWRFTFSVPQEPWSYIGGLFRIEWYIEARADVGRGRIHIPLVSQPPPQALVRFHVTPHAS